MNRLLIACLLMYLLSGYAYSDPIVFQFGPGDGGGNVSCGNDKDKGDIPPVLCSFENNSNELIISRKNWNGNAILTKDDDTITGLCSGSVRKDINVANKYILAPTCIVIDGLKFFFNDTGGKLTCNGQEMAPDQNGVNCQFNKDDELLLSRVGWKGNALLVRGELITCQCAGSFKRNKDQNNWYNVDFACSSRYVKPTTATGESLVTEWYADLPWHQKLSTKDSNLIDTPFVLPYAALLPGLCKIKNINNKIDEPRCMLRYGVLNIMVMQRTDTLYKQGEAPTDKNCTDCVEVKIKIQRVNTLVDNDQGYQADTIRNNAYTIENYPDNGKNFSIPSLSFALTEATVFAPWRPWYTGHYCARDADNLADSVCYEDYFTTQLIATSEQAWLWDAPALFEPKNEKPEPTFEKFCASGLNYCDMYLGKVDWVKDPKITDCGTDPIANCVTEVIAKTERLDQQFDASIKDYTDDDRYPWSKVKSDIDLSKDIDTNPFIGFYNLERFKTPSTEVDPVTGNKIYFDSLFRGTHYVLPKQCTQANFLGARQGSQRDIDRLADCVLNFEIHTNGYYRQWRYLYGEKAADGEGYTLTRDQIAAAIKDVSIALPGINANQYGRTMFLYAGVPEQHIPVTFKLLDDGISLYDKVYNASIYTQYLPMVNPADQTLKTKSYTDDFWHAFFMSNHMNQTPDHFIRGIRGRTLWHNEYRSNILYNSAEKIQEDKTHAIDGTEFEGALGHVDFPAGFQAANATAPFHGNTCDACHIRNGSGVPLMPNGKLPQIHVDNGMRDKEFEIHRDYTYSNKELPSMKMVLYDLGTDRSDGYYTNKVMNFYGDSFHVNQKNKLPTYSMEYVDIKKGDGYEVVVDDVDRDKYHHQRIEITSIDIGTDIVCMQVGGIVTEPDNISGDIWPNNCTDVSGPAILKAMSDDEPKVGFMHLLGRRLGNTPMIEMISDQVIIDTQEAQNKLTGYPGNYILVPGTRGGGITNFRDCSSGVLSASSEDCYLSRWGWIGDRASLEDQIANAANVEMNMTSTESYNELHSSPPANSKHLVRYNKNVCGPADAHCIKQAANSNITEQEIKDMATYQRWIGIPNRSEYQVSSIEVQEGEEIFKDLECNSCHVIDKIAFVKDDNMLPDEEREHLEKLRIQSGGQTNYPFISYLGTDLLLHDMGYLSQVARAPKNENIRNVQDEREAYGQLMGYLSQLGNALEKENIRYDNGMVKDEHRVYGQLMEYLSQVLKAPENEKIRHDDGTVKDEYKAYVQYIRTPALKGLRFNRFVTDSNHNTKAPLDISLPEDVISGCDFLLHDGRACDAIEAAYLHDGPEIKELGTIDKLNGLDAIRLNQLRAFLYSL